MECPECGREMQNLGNIGDFIYTSNPPEWDETNVCHKCRKKTVVRVHGEEVRFENYDYLEDYEYIQPEEDK